MRKSGLRNVAVGADSAGTPPSAVCPKWLPPLIYAAIGIGLLFGARSSVFIGEDSIKIENSYGWLQQTSFPRLFLSREVGEDGVYYRPLENVVLGAIAKTSRSGGAEPYRLIAGLIWLLCAASIVVPLRRAKLSVELSWTAAILLMASPYNSWYFISAVLMMNPLIIPVAVGLWWSHQEMETRKSTALGVVAAALLTYGGCLARENAALFPVVMLVLALALRRKLPKSTASFIGASAFGVVLYLLQRHWVLAHDPAPHPLVFDWGMARCVGTAYFRYVWLLLSGAFRVQGGLISPAHWLAYSSVWLVFVVGLIALKRPRAKTAAWIALVLLCTSEIPASILMNDEIMPVRATILLALVLVLVGLYLARKSAKLRAGVLLLGAALGAFWSVQAARNVYASRETGTFLHLHSSPPYSWKVEGELAQYDLSRGDPKSALAAAQASERLRPSWLTAVLTASIAASYFPHPDMAALAALARSGGDQPAAQIGYVNLGVAFGKNGDWENAVKCFEFAIKLYPAYAPAWTELAWAMTSVGNWPAAIESARHAISLHPDDADSWQNLAYAQFRLRRWSDSAKTYERLYRIYPRWPASRLYWAMAESALGHEERAINILSTEPNLNGDPYAQKYLASLKHKRR